MLQLGLHTPGLPARLRACSRTVTRGLHLQKDKARRPSCQSTRKATHRRDQHISRWHQPENKCFRPSSTDQIPITAITQSGWQVTGTVHPATKPRVRRVPTAPYGSQDHRSPQLLPDAHLLGCRGNHWHLNGCIDAAQRAGRVGVIHMLPQHLVLGRSRRLDLLNCRVHLLLHILLNGLEL